MYTICGRATISSTVQKSIVGYMTLAKHESLAFVLEPQADPKVKKTITQVYARKRMFIRASLSKPTRGYPYLV